MNRLLKGLLCTATLTGWSYNSSAQSDEAIPPQLFDQKESLRTPLLEILKLSKYSQLDDLKKAVIAAQAALDSFSKQLNTSAAPVESTPAQITPAVQPTPQPMPAATPEQPAQPQTVSTPQP